MSLSTHSFLRQLLLCSDYVHVLCRCTPLLLQWCGGRYFYIRAMAEHQKRILRRHKKVLFSDESLCRFGSFDVDKIFASATLLDLDIRYSHKRAGFKSCEEYYQWSSCCNYMHKVSEGMKKADLFNSIKYTVVG